METVAIVEDTHKLDSSEHDTLLPTIDSISEPDTAPVADSSISAPLADGEDTNLENETLTSSLDASTCDTPLADAAQAQAPFKKAILSETDVSSPFKIDANHVNSPNKSAENYGNSSTNVEINHVDSVSETEKVVNSTKETVENPVKSEKPIENNGIALMKFGEKLAHPSETFAFSSPAVSSAENLVVNSKPDELVSTSGEVLAGEAVETPTDCVVTIVNNGGEPSQNGSCQH